MITFKHNHDDNIKESSLPDFNGRNNSLRIIIAENYRYPFILGRWFICCDDLLVMSVYFFSAIPQLLLAKFTGILLCN